MFSNVFQGGASGVEIFTSTGKDPLKLWKISSGCSKCYDRTVKGFVYFIDKPSTSTMEIPQTNKESLGISQSILVFQLRCYNNKPFTLEVTVLDQNSNRLRLHISTKFHNFEANTLHAQLPLMILYPDRWCNLIFDLKELTDNCFKPSKFVSIESITIHPSSRIRKVFTLLTCDSINFDCPSNFSYPLGTEYYDQVRSLFLFSLNIYFCFGV